MKYKQQGSAHVIIVIVLVVALLGALGYIFWQNFIKTKPETAKTQATTATSTKTDTDTTTTPKTGYTIDNWGITIPVTGTGYEEAASPANNPEHFAVTTQAIVSEAAKIGCDDNTVGQLEQDSSSIVGGPVTYSAKIGNYYYGFYPRSEAACVDDNGNAPQTLNTLMDNAINDLKTAIVGTTAS